MGKLPDFFTGKKSFSIKKSLPEESIPLPSEKRDIKREDKKEIPEITGKKLGKIEEDASHKTEENKPDFMEPYWKALRYFEKADYHNASLNFLNFLARSGEAEPEKKIRARVYLAYSLLFLGQKPDKSVEELIEKSRNYFLELYREVASRHGFYSRIVLGLARSSRFLENYPEGIDIILKENLILAKKGIRNHLYLELGYYYFYENQMEKALAYFKKSELPIANRKFFEILLEKENTSLYLLTLFEKEMIPLRKDKNLKIKLQKKILREARRYFKEEKKEEAYFLLKRLITDFPYDFIVEEANFFLGEFYFQEMQYQKSLYFYNQALSNEFLDYDAASFFKKGLIYYRTGNEKQAIKEFNHIRENFVSSKYYQPALDWIREIERRARARYQQNKKEVPLKENEIEKPKKSLNSLQDDLFLKEEIPEDELY
jgi:TolA-binding protein